MRAGIQALEEVLHRGWLCEDKRAEESQVEEGYIFPGEMIRMVVYQEAGAVRQRLVQQRAAVVLQAEAEYDQGEYILLPTPTPSHGHAVGEFQSKGRATCSDWSSEQERGMAYGWSINQL